MRSSDGLVPNPAHQNCVSSTAQVVVRTHRFPRPTRKPESKLASPCGDEPTMSEIGGLPASVGGLCWASMIQAPLIEKTERREALPCELHSCRHPTKQTAPTRYASRRCIQWQARSARAWSTGCETQLQDQDCCLAATHLGIFLRRAEAPSLKGQVAALSRLSSDTSRP